MHERLDGAPVSELATYREWAPPPAWRHAVACCWEQHVFVDRVQHVLPDGHADLLVYEDGRAEVVGIQDRVARPALQRGTVIRGIRLRPEAIAAAFEVPAADLQNLSLPAADVFGERASRRLVDPTVVDRWVRSIEPSARTATAVRLLESRSVQDTADELGITDRHLRRLLLHDVGLAPKVYQRVLRLQRFLRAVEDDADIATAAATAGYADQAHVTRDSRDLSGETPARLLELRGLRG
jgi:AraC-like DNA-binding protein